MGRPSLGPMTSPWTDPNADPCPRRARPAARALLVAMLGLGSGAWTASGPPGAASAQPAPERLAYRLEATLRAPEAPLRPGHFARVVDVAVRPDGVRLVLDGRQAAVHAIAPSGTPLAVWPLSLPEEGTWQPRAVAAGRGAGAVVLSVGDTMSGEVSRFDALDGAGRSAGRWTSEAQVGYWDAAMTAGGEVLAVRTQPHPAAVREGAGGAARAGGLDVYSGGVLVERGADPQLDRPIAVDVGPDGRIWVIDWRPAPDQVGPLPPPTTPEPSDAPHGAAQEPPPEGIVELAPDRRFLARHAFYDADDVAAGPHGVVVARQLEVLPLDAPRDPLWSAPADTLSFGAGAAVGLRVSAPADGALEIGLRHCRLQGLARLPRAARPIGPATFVGALAWPPLDGPRHPVAVAAGADGLALLTGRFEPLGGLLAPPGPPPGAVIGGADGAPQAVQRWSPGGALLDQLGLCGDEDDWYRSQGDVRGVRDMAVDGGTILAARADLLEGRRASAPLGGWVAWPDAWLPEPLDEAADPPVARTTAIDAADGLGVALDGAAARLFWFDPATGAPLGIGDASALVEGGVLADVALGAASPAGDRLVALAEPAAWAVHVLVRRGSDGSLAPLARIAAPAPPRRIARLPSPGALGDVVVLGDGGLARHAADGSLRAAWTGPDDAEVVDVAADSDGLVYAPFVRTEPPRPDPGDGRRAVRDAGILVFAPDGDAPGPVPPTPAPSTPEPPSCRLEGDKRAAPARLRLGEQVTVTLRVAPSCAEVGAVRRLVLVVDTSRSMGWDDALAEATDQLAFALTYLGADDEVALVAFDDAERARILVPPTTRHARVATALAGLRPDGDTRVAPALALAAALVAADRPTEVLVATDARFSDAATTEADALRAAGAGLSFLVYPHRNFDPLDVRILAGYAGGDRARVVASPTRRRVAEVVAALPSARSVLAGAALDVVDVVPRNMRYVEDSSSPPAAWDPGSRELRWRFAPPSNAALLGYRLEPLEPGEWPTNLFAAAVLTDALGARVEHVLPVPRVEVLAPGPEARRAYLPYGALGACLRVPSMALALAIDTSSSMDEPAAGGGTKLDAARAAASALLGGLRPGIDDAALVAFDAASRVASPLGAGPAARAAALAALRTAPGTALELGLAEAGRALDAAPDGASRAVLLLSDGRTSGRPDDARAAAADLEARRIARYVVALGPDADRALLAEVASGPGAFAHEDDPARLRALFEALLERVRCAAGG